MAVEEPRWTAVHVSYRVGSRHRLDRGAAGRAIAAGRTGTDAVVETHDELQAGARGFAVPVLGVTGLEASVGVVTLGSLDAELVSFEVTKAARELAATLA